MGGISRSPEDKRARVDRSLRLRWRLESERAPLIRPGHWQIDKTLQAKAARQASFNCRLDADDGELRERLKALAQELMVPRFNGHGGYAASLSACSGVL
jgi:hypothetical protein